MRNFAPLRTALLLLYGTSILLFAGCASVPMATKASDAAAKSFPRPADGSAALYIYRDSFGGKALRKMLSMDGKAIGQTADKVYFYKEIAPGPHVLSTESEFGDNTLAIQAAPGRTYFVRQYIKLGVFIGGSALELVSEEEGRKAVLGCQRAEPLAMRPSILLAQQSSACVFP